MLHYAGEDFADTQYTTVPKEGGGWDASAWFKNAKPSLLDKNAYMNLPYVVDGDLVVTQSTAVYQYLGRRLKLAGSTEAELVKDEQTLCEAYDLRNAAIRILYATPPNQYPEALKNHFATVLPGSCKKFEGWLAQAQTPFFSGAKPRPGDFHVFELLDQHM